MSEEIGRSDAAVGEGVVPSRDQPEVEAAPAAEKARPEEPPLELSEEARQPARQVRNVLKAWTERVAGTGGAGRGATITARMATARALAELRRVQLPQLPDIEPVHDYLRRTTAALSQAAHDIERNRYSLHAMEHQLEHLAGLEKRLLPEETHEHADEATEQTGESTDGSASGDSAP